MNSKSQYPNLFSPGKIGKLDIKNRVVVTPVGLPYAASNGEVSDRILAYFEERAKGGAGIVMSGIVLVEPITGRVMPNELILTTRAQATSFEALARTVHKYDAKLFLQLYHPGKATSKANLSGETPVSCSPLLTNSGDTTRELSTKEVEDMVQNFIKSALLAKGAGVDGVEVHAAHGYLINQFMTPFFNKRTDKYGGSFENRMRFPCEIIEGIRKACGPDYTICVRISADEFIDGGITLEDSVEIAKLFEAKGVNVINVNCGLQETSQFNREPPSFQQGWKKHLATTIRKAVTVPVIAVNTIKTPEFAESLLEEGVCDFIGLSRPHLADPHWTKKTKEGRAGEIRTCISCLTCMAEFVSGRIPKCSVNPMLGREWEFQHLNKNGEGRSVVVIGGGPGGLEAAQVLARRNFKVTLFEESGELGGQLNYADKPPLKEKITWLKENMANRAINRGVDVRLNTKATVDMVKALNPVGLFIAVGASPIRPASIPGISGENVFTVPEVLSGAADIKGKKVVLIGSGLAGMETAVFLGAKGYEISIVEMLPVLGNGVFPQVLADISNELKPFDPKFYMEHRLVSIEKDGVSLQDSAGKSVALKADAVMLAMGVCPRKDIVNEFSKAFEDIEVRVVGDAVNTGRIIEATTDGFTKAWVFEA